VFDIAVIETCKYCKCTALTKYQMAIPGYIYEINASFI